MGDERGAGPPDGSDAEDEIPLDVIPLHSTNLLTVLDADGTVRYESPSIERILGFEQDDLVGEPVAQWFHPDDSEAVVDAFEGVVAAEGPQVATIEYRHERADGTYQWVESAASADPTPDGNYVINTRDIAERKARERELERTNERLDEFAEVVSHDLRNPLNVAHGRLKMAQERADGEHLADVDRALERMQALIDDLLTLARTGETVREPEAVDLADLSEQCWQTIETGAAGLDVDVRRPVSADRARLRQLLENLLGNAVEHGGPAVNVTVGELEDRAGFYVADDGTGIDADQRERVFERGHSGTATGTGFGLAIVEEVAEAHGWAVDAVESAAGGARVEVSGVEHR